MDNEIIKRRINRKIGVIEALLDEKQLKNHDLWQGHVNGLYDALSYL